jgi:hypothetical protein
MDVLLSQVLGHGVELTLHGVHVSADEWACERKGGAIVHGFGGVVQRALHDGHEKRLRWYAGLIC